MSRFFLGFAVGVALGAAAVLLGAQTDEAGERPTFATATGGLRSLVDGALQAGQAAASAKEQAVREEFRARLKAGAQPSAPYGEVWRGKAPPE
jgi:gas vesicle protein